MNPLTFTADSLEVGEITAATHAGASRGLFLGAEHVLQVSNKSVPIEEGTLERSGHTSVDREALEAAIAYDTPYAARQHEELDYAHDNGRTAKFLENAMNSEIPTIQQIIGSAIKSSLGM